jgi:hypothetical protein
MVVSCCSLMQDGFQVVCLDVDRRVVGQLGAPDFVSDSSGRIQVVSKAVLRKRGGVSPDRAEAVLLALYEPDKRRVRFRWLRLLRLFRGMFGLCRSRGLVCGPAVFLWKKFFRLRRIRVVM